MAAFVLLLAWHRPIAHIAHVHVAFCSVVRAAQRARGKVRVVPHDQETEDDLEERGYPVTWCRCTKGLRGLSAGESHANHPPAAQGEPPKEV